MTTQPPDDGKKLIDAAQDLANWHALHGLPEHAALVRSFLTELAELREKAEALDYLTGKRPWRLWAMVTDANGKIPDDCPIALKNVLKCLIEQKERP